MRVRPIRLASLIEVMLEHRPRVLDSYARDPRWPIRLEVARHPLTATSTLRHLSQDLSAAVRGAVSMNPRTPPFTFVVLSIDSDPEVTDAAASHPHTPAEIILPLLGNASPPSDRAILQWALGTFSRVPDIVLFYLLGSNDEMVRRETILALTRLR